jgi:hypothetical protein
MNHLLRPIFDRVIIKELDRVPGLRADGRAACRLTPSYNGLTPE